MRWAHYRDLTVISMARAGRPGRTTSRTGPLACVLGDVDLVRALGLAAVASVVLTEPGNPARYSRSAVTAFDKVDSARAPEAAIDQLLGVAREQTEPPILFYDGDWDLLLVSRHRARLAEAFRFVVPDAELVEDLVDKARFMSLAARLDLPVPPARQISGDEPMNGDPGLRFPLVAKPLTRHHDTWRPIATTKAAHLAGPADLRELRRRLADSDLQVLLQEAVPGPESRIESYHVYRTGEGEIAGEFTGRKLRTHPPGYGYSTALTITATSDVLELGRDLCERMDLRGVAKLDFKRDDDGRLHLLEVNPRFNLWHHPGALAGVNLPQLVYEDLTGLPRSRPGAARAEVNWCSLAHDLQAARAGGVGVGSWLRWLATCEAKSGFALDDPLPLPRAALWRAARQVRTITRRAG